jgi:CAAX prenyl protease-like protein
MSKRGWFEVAASVLTAGLHFVFIGPLNARGPFIVVTILAWSVYIFLRIRHSPENRRDFGLTTDGLRQSARTASWILAVGVTLSLIIGLWRGTVRWSPHMLVLAALYPLWGLVQQLLVQAMVVRNLLSVLSRPLVVVIAAVLFGLVHVPDVYLALATALMGGLFTVVFIRWRNVWALGVCHGLLGVVFYFWVLGTDPLEKVVPRPRMQRTPTAAWCHPGRPGQEPRLALRAGGVPDASTGGER